MENNNFEKKQSFKKAIQYADEILNGDYTFESLKGQLPDSWIHMVKTELESRGYLVLPESKTIENSESSISLEKISEQIDQEKNNFIDSTDKLVDQVGNIGVSVNSQQIDQVKQETNFDQNISELKSEAIVSLNRLEYVERKKQELESYFKEKTQSTEDWKYKPDLLEGELVLMKCDELLLQLGADKIQAHGIAKGNIGEQFKDLLNILTNGIDSRGGGQLYTAPLVIPNDMKAGAGAALGTGGGTAYRDGGFIILAKKGINEIKSIDDIGGVLVNQGVADSLPELVNKLKETFQDLSIDSYSNSPNVISEINDKNEV